MPLPSVERASDAAELNAINLGFDWSAGDRVNYAAANMAAQRQEIKAGSSSSPLTTVGPIVKVSRTGAVTQAKIEEAGGVGTDGVDQLAAILGISKGTANEEVQGVGVGGIAYTESTKGSPGNDACGLYGVGWAKAASEGALGLGLFAVGRNDSPTGQATAAELSCLNYSGSPDTFETGFISDHKAILVTANGNAPSAAVLNVGKPEGRQTFDVCLGITSQGPITGSTVFDAGKAEYSLRVEGEHSKGALYVKSGSGHVGVGVEPGVGTQVLAKADTDNVIPLIARCFSASQAVSAFEVQTSAAANLFRVGPTGNLFLADGATIGLGTGTGTKIGTATTQKLGFFNKAPIVQPTAITSPSAELASLKTAVDAIRTALTNLGLTA
jgi:hypothetical protein